MSDLQATWYAVRATGAWPHEAEYIYTSAEPPVEAAEHDRVLAQLAAATQRAEAAEADRNAVLGANAMLNKERRTLLERAEAAEAKLAEYIAWIDALPRWALDQATTALARGEQGEVQP